MQARFGLIDRTHTMSINQLTDVQLTNLYLLQAIRLGIAQDRVATCYKFGQGCKPS